MIWDAWADLPLEERTELILQAFQQAEGNAYRESIALANGLTFPEAYAAGMLPHQIIPVLRAGDAVSLEQCYQAMFDEGASKLFDPNKPELRFFSREDAEAAKERLIRRLPQSEQVWVILQEVGRVDDWILR